MTSAAIVCCTRASTSNAAVRATSAPVLATVAVADADTAAARVTSALSAIAVALVPARTELAYAIAEAAAAACAEIIGPSHAAIFTVAYTAATAAIAFRCSEIKDAD